METKTLTTNIQKPTRDQVFQLASLHRTTLLLKSKASITGFMLLFSKASTGDGKQK